MTKIADNASEAKKRLIRDMRLAVRAHPSENCEGCPVKWYNVASRDYALSFVCIEATGDDAPDCLFTREEHVDILNTMLLRAPCCEGLGPRSNARKNI